MLDLLRLGGRDEGTAPGMPRTVGDVRAKLDRDHSVTLPAGSEFGGQERASFRFTRTMLIGDVIVVLACAAF